MNSKALFTVNISETGESALAAPGFLRSVDDEKTYYKNHGLRPALGIYNISISRICQKLTALSGRLEQLFTGVKSIDELQTQDELCSEIIDYLELTLYAAAEHVDDIDLIIQVFFDDRKKMQQSRVVKELKNKLKKHRDIIRSTTNAIKHNQARLRLFSLEFTHSNIATCLHGYVVECVENGRISARMINQDPQNRVISITSLMWEVVVFLYYASDYICEFLCKIQPGIRRNSSNECGIREAVTAMCRLPLYSFDEIPPFENGGIKIIGDQDSCELTNSNIYGSINRPWRNSDSGKMGIARVSHAGDGISKEFVLVKPKGLSIIQW